jgi:hypothetical protein
MMNPYEALLSAGPAVSPSSAPPEKLDPQPDDTTLVTRSRPAAESLAKAAQTFTPGITAAEMTENLRAAYVYDSKGDGMMFEQAQVLDQLFHRLVVHSLGGKSLNGTELPEHVNEQRLALALRTQKLCRAALSLRSDLGNSKK